MNTKKFFPVIHCVDPLKEQGIRHAIHNTRIAIDNGADGVFLIGLRLNFKPLSEIYENVRKQFPEAWIGINFLDVSVSCNWTLLGSIGRHLKGINGLWIDTLPYRRLDVSASVEVFGGVAFKYIDPHLRGKELKESCGKALQVVDVITTSGTKTGSPPDPQKLVEIRGNIGEKRRLALATGVTEENVDLFLPTVSDFLVAASIVERRKDLGGQEYFIPEKVKSLGVKIHQ